MLAPLVVVTVYPYRLDVVTTFAQFLHASGRHHDVQIPPRGDGVDRRSHQNLAYLGVEGQVWQGRRERGVPWHASDRGRSQTPAIGVQVMLGTMRGQVVRHFEDGVAIEFAVIQRPETLDQEFNAPRS